MRVPILIIVLVGLLSTCNAQASRRLCCSGGVPGYLWRVPSYNSSVLDCPAAPTLIPWAEPANSEVIQNMLPFFPYCKPMLDQWAAENRYVLLQTRPIPNNGFWEATKANMINTLNSAYSIVRALGHGSSVLPWISKDCLHTLMRMTCSIVFREAQNFTAYVPFGSPPYLPKPIPQSYVTDFDIIQNRYRNQYHYIDNDPAKPEETPTCRMILAEFLQQLIAQNRTTNTSVALLLPYYDDCECGCSTLGSSRVIATQPRFNGTQTWAAGLPRTQVTNSTTPRASFAQSDWPCYLPWAKAPEDNPLSYCGIRCPSPFRTNEQYKSAAILMGILGWISYLSTFFVFVTMVCMPRYRHFPANLVLFVLFSSHIVGFCFVFTITRGWRDTVCQDRITPRWGIKSRNAACIFNALTIIFGGLGTTFFWCAVAINSFIAIYLKRDSILRSRWFEIGTHAICWGVPFVCTLIALAARQIGTPQQLLFCFVTEDPYNPKNQRTAFSYQYPLFFGPIGFCIVLATGAIVMVLWEMRNLHAASGSGRFNKHIRIALFLVIFLGLYAFVFAYRFTITSDGNKWRAALQTWARAAFEGVPSHGLTAEPSYGLFMAFLFFIGVQGALISLLFGSNTDVLTFWGERIQNIREGRSFFSGITSYTASSKVGASSVRTTGNAEN